MFVKRFYVHECECISLTIHATHDIHILYIKHIITCVQDDTCTKMYRCIQVGIICTRLEQLLARQATVVHGWYFGFAKKKQYLVTKH